MTRAQVLYTVGVVLVALTGFFSPWPWTGFALLGAGAVWAAYDLIDVEESESDDTPPTPTRRI